MAQNEEDIWRRLDFRYSELREFVTTMRLETEEEALGVRDAKGNWGETTPRWFDEEAGREVKAWFVLPYIEALDNQDLAERLELARARIPFLDRAFAARQLTPEFLMEWGLFSEVAGSLSILLPSSTAVAGLRSGAAGGEAVSVDAQREWYCHYMSIYLRESNKKQAANIKFHSLVHAILDGKIDVNFPVEWFEAFIDLKEPTKREEYGRLKRTYTDIPKTEYKAAEPREDLPPLDLVFPLP